MQDLCETARRIADRLRGAREVHIISHIDADGLCAGTLASLSLTRLGVEHELEFVKQLDVLVIARLRDANPELVWLTDLGSGLIDHLEGLDVVVTDHHRPALPEPKGDDLLAYSRSIDELHLNPHLVGLNGALDISGSGLTYIVSKTIDDANMEHLPLAVIGSVGDLQDVEHCRLVGTNRAILEAGVDNGLIESAMDIRLFGRETRPLHKLLQYSSDPLIPGLTGRGTECLKFIQELGVALKREEHWRRWIDLTMAEKRTLVSALVRLLLSKGYGSKNTKRLIGEVYTLPREDKGTELHDAKEFATLLNACGRYGKADIGFHVCCGDRAKYLKRARTLLRGHRQTLASSIQFVNELGITKREHIQYFHAGDNIDEKVVGIVAGMLLPHVDDLPLFAFANSTEGVKVSARSGRSYIDRGLDLSMVMRKAAEKVGGIGGGHNVAAGATIPKDTEEEFLEEAERIVKGQLAR